MIMRMLWRCFYQILIQNHKTTSKQQQYFSLAKMENFFQTYKKKEKHYLTISVEKLSIRGKKVQDIFLNKLTSIRKHISCYLNGKYKNRKLNKKFKSMSKHIFLLQFTVFLLVIAGIFLIIENGVIEWLHLKSDRKMCNLSVKNIILWLFNLSTEFYVIPLVLVLNWI